MTISQLNPRQVFHYFEALSAIPHGSGHTEQIADYCLSIAAEHGLRGWKDAYGNVMICKPGTAGREQCAPVVLQGHLDMVCESLPERAIDMEREAICLMTDGAWVWADGTTLGGDDGIAVAYALALLTADDIPHPPLEVLLTSDEEVGLRGARELNPEGLNGRRLINIDSEEEGILTVSCAGAVRVFCTQTVEEQPAQGTAVRIHVGGLLGGHSGIDIDKHRCNAIKVLIRLLDSIHRQVGIGVAELHAGGRLNVIPQTAEAVVVVPTGMAGQVCRLVEEFDADLKKRCAPIEPEAFASVTEELLPERCTTAAGTRDVIFNLTNLPDGVFAMSPGVAGLVETSCNLGAAQLKDGRLETGLMVRSNVDSGKEDVVRRMELLMEYMGGSCRLEDSYPAWEYRHDSPLREIMVQAFVDLYGHEPQICAMHAGLECGLLSDKLPGADMVSFGPNLIGVHTPAERMDVASVERCWNYLLHVLELMN